MKPVENFDAEVAFQNGKTIYIIDRSTAELFILNEVKNTNFLSGAFINGNYIYYVGKDWTNG